MSTNKQALREKFEAWAEEAGALPWGHLKKQRTTSGNYSVQIYTYMWKAWSACHETLLDELEAAEKRIAELEAREVKIPELKMLSDYLREVTLREREDIILGVKLEFHRNLKAAGITVKGDSE